MLSVQAVVAGAFIYIACSNLISNEFQASRDVIKTDKRDTSEKVKTQRLVGLIKLGFVLLACIFVVAIFSLGGQDLTTPDSNLPNIEA